MKTTAAITDLPVSPEDDRHHRVVSYVVLMSIRTICFILVVVLPDWWKLLAAFGAIFLPYFAVVMANARGGRAPGAERPEQASIAGPAS